MEELRRLARIVTNRKQKELPVFIPRKKNQSKEQQLFRMLTEGKPVSDEQAAAALYDSTPSDPQYKMLKSRLRSKLSNQLFFLDFSDRRLKASNRYLERCRHLLHQGRVLQMQGEVKLARKFLTSALNLALELEFTEQVVSCQKALATLYAFNDKQLSYRSVQEQWRKYRELYMLESEAEEYFLQAKLELSRSVRKRKEYLPEMERNLLRLSDLWQQTQSFNIFEPYYQLNLWHKELIGDFEAIIRITSETEAQVADKKINLKRFDHRYNKYINVAARLRVKDYERGLKVSAEYIKDFESSSVNWFAFMENYFLLAIQAGYYHLAHQLSATVAQNPAYVKVKPLAQQRWALYRAYLYFVSPTEELKSSFNYVQFLNDVPEFSRDKQGFNVAILIVQFLNYLRKEDMESLLYRIESLKKYISAHLRDVFSERSRLFFKLLMLTVQEDFDPKICRQKGQKYYEKLKKLPTPGEAFAEIEIIPYENLWEMILNILAKKV